MKFTDRFFERIQKSTQVAVYLDVSWSVLGEDRDSAEETDARLQGSFVPLVAGEFTIQAYGRIALDSDGFALASAFSVVEGLKRSKLHLFDKELSKRPSTAIT